MSLPREMKRTCTHADMFKKSFFCQSEGPPTGIEPSTVKRNELELHITIGLNLIKLMNEKR